MGVYDLLIRCGKMTGDQIFINEILNEDASDILAIYALGIVSGQATFETETPSWSQWHAAHLPVCRLAARLPDGRVIAWAALSPVSRRAVYAGVAEVSIYVHPDWRRRGVGRALLTELVKRSEEAGIWTLQAGMFSENMGSLRLHEGCGFRLVGRRERIGQLNGVWRDTLLLERRSE
jgi:L-amino acid N-acyltransferase YncA